MSKNHIKACKNLNYAEHLLTLASAITGFVSISAFTSLNTIPLGITRSAVGLKFVQSLKELRSIIQLSKKIKKHDQIVLPGKTKLDTTEVLFSKALIDNRLIVMTNLLQ